MTGCLRCLNEPLRDWQGETALEFFDGLLGALQWVLDCNRSGVVGTFLSVEVVAYVFEDGPPLSLGVLRLENATHEQLADHAERLTGAPFRACGLC